MKTRDHKGVSQALITEFVEKELPLIERTMAEVQAGDTLSSGEIEAMATQLDQVKYWYVVANEFPEYKDLLARIIDSYDEITKQALENEGRQDH